MLEPCDIYTISKFPVSIMLLCFIYCGLPLSDFLRLFFGLNTFLAFGELGLFAAGIPYLA